jgi:hypothetical protein
MKQNELELENSKLKAEIKALAKTELDCMESIKAYTHWLFNADSDFVEKAWRTNPMLANHLLNKLTGMAGAQGFMASGMLARFDRELSENNREILYRYILENHLNKW